MNALINGINIQSYLYALIRNSISFDDTHSSGYCKQAINVYLYPKTHLERSRQPANKNMRQYALIDLGQHKMQNSNLCKDLKKTFFARKDWLATQIPGAAEHPARNKDSRVNGTTNTIH